MPLPLPNMLPLCDGCWLGAYESVWKTLDGGKLSISGPLSLMTFVAMTFYSLGAAHGCCLAFGAGPPLPSPNFFMIPALKRLVLDGVSGGFGASFSTLCLPVVESDLTDLGGFIWELPPIFVGCVFWNFKAGAWAAGPAVFFFLSGELS